jgi:acyl phosphate:glycerol-3-phosphate acyltransferase
LLKEIIGLGLIAYLLGAIPFGLLVCKLKGHDLRKTGSGNIGATNVYRGLGFKYAFLVFCLDSFKGYLPVYLSFFLSDQPYVHISIGFISIIGHSLTIFAGFKGGKGAATGLGVLLALAPDVFMILFVLAILLIFGTKYVSVATISCSVLAPILLLILDYPEVYVFFIGIICLFIIWRHKANIERLLKGQENKIR